jgi:hypothetical protein
VLIPLLQPLVRMMRMLLSMLQLLVVRMIVQVLLVMVQGVFLVVFVLVVECVFASVLKVLVPELLEDLQMCVLSVVLVESHVVVRCFLCPLLPLPLLLVAVLALLLYFHCPFPGLRILHHHIGLIAGFF